MKTNPEFPEEWDIVNLGKIAFDFLSGGTPSTKRTEFWEGKIPWMTSAHISGRVVSEGMKFISQLGLEKSAAKIVPKNSILIATRVGIGKVTINLVEMAISQDLTGMVLDDGTADKDFIYWLLSNSTTKLKSMAQGSTIKGLLRKELERLKIPLPPLPEQQAIAKVLSTVDLAISKAEEKITGTRRLKTGLMNLLLTQGLGHSQFKETKIGSVPKSWKVVKLGDVVKVKGGKRLPKEHKLLDYPTSFPYIRVVDFVNMTVDVENLKYLSAETQKTIHRYTINKSDVFISIAGTIGLVGVIPPELDGANLTENAAKLSNLKGISNYFLVYLFHNKEVQRQIKAFTGKGTQPKLALFRIEKIKIPLPPLPEQQQITEILTTVDKKLELEQQRKQILQRVKTGLMNELLTGKRRVPDPETFPERMEIPRGVSS